MSDINMIEGAMSVQGKKFGLLISRFNSFIVDSLEKGAIDTLKRHGASDSEIEIVRVPGAFELPVAAGVMAKSNKYDAIITLGAVIRGGTPHFEYVAGACVNGIANVATSTDVPVIFGVLTVDTIEQAIERAGTKAGNKGSEAALSAIEMVNVMAKLK